jgi:hypothetical protein
VGQDTGEREREKEKLGKKKGGSETYKIKVEKKNVQILCFWTLSIVLSLSKNRPVYFSEHKASETAFCLRLQVKPTQLGLNDRVSP